MIDNVFEKWLAIYGSSSGNEDYENKLMAEYILFDSELCRKYGKKEIRVTNINNKSFFISNGISKGFILEKKKLSKNFDYPQCYVNFVNSFGMIQDLIGFKNEYLENLRNLFYEENAEIGIDFWEEKFLKKSNNTRIFGDLNINTIKIFAEEANGNVFLMNSAGKVYLYANDHNYKNIVLVEGCPKYTFYKCNGIETIESFIDLFFDDFCQ